jgi:hypothetical protein
MSPAFKVINGIMLLMFIFSAVVQFNDPDPVRWVLIYLAAAVVCVLAFLRRERWWSVAILGVFALVWGIALAPGVVGRVPFLEMFSAWEMKDIGVEESREMYGLYIIAAWMAVVAVRDWRRKREYDRRALSFESQIGPD